MLGSDATQVSPSVRTWCSSMSGATFMFVITHLLRLPFKTKSTKFLSINLWQKHGNMVVAFFLKRGQWPIIYRFASVEEATTRRKGEWRSSTTTLGAPSVMTTSGHRKLLSSVECWVFLRKIIIHIVNKNSYMLMSQFTLILSSKSIKHPK